MSDLLAELAEEFGRELQEGSSPSVEDYAARHPELADRIRELFPALEVLQRAGGQHAEQVEDEGVGFVAGVLARLRQREGSFARYELRGEVGRGGQGAVLAVWDGDLRRDLAMKLAQSNDPTRERSRPGGTRALGRFLEEAQVTAQLDHPGIVPVYELGLATGGDVYFTMKLVKGSDLRSVFERVRSGKEDWSLTRALNVLSRVCEAMAYAHSKGVIHRDLKPGNVMVGKFGEVYVMDWGLARVLGREDEKDIRIRPDAEGERRVPGPEVSAVDLGTPLVTMDGDVVGTPAYMAPEQARGEIETLGPQADVYSLGAMLYELVSGEMPYVESGTRPGNREVWRRVQAGPPAPLASQAADVAPELLAIVEKAMARAPEERYADMAELGDDLRAYLERRVVRAYEAGAVAELKKWMVRNRALASSLAAGLLAVVVGLVASWILKGQSDAHAKEASESAVREKARADEVLRLSASADLDELEREVAALWPPWPEFREEYRDWLVRADDLVAGLDPDPASDDPGHRARLAELEARALPTTAEEREADRRAHPAHDELVGLRARLAALERAHAVSEGRASVREHALDAADLPTRSDDAMKRAWNLVDPNRTEYGREAEGLALARHALELVENEAEYESASRLLVQALAANGLDDEAAAEASEAGAVSETLRLALEQDLADLRRVDRAQEIADLASEVARLETEVASARIWRFAEREDLWWHRELSELVQRIDAFADPETGPRAWLSSANGWGIHRRLEWADSIEERTQHGERASALWAEAVASISDTEECAAYGGLVIEPQLGLLPIGRDPGSGLWEFAHPLTGEVPERDAQGRLRLTPECGLVFVLLPGGTFWMGAQGVNPSNRNYDSAARPAESPVHDVRLTPFFLSKYELTQEQWFRLTGTSPSLFSQVYQQWQPMLPVEQVDRDVCLSWMTRAGLTLPSEAQWEYATRGGTSTPWSTGATRDSLAGYVNIHDETARVARVGPHGQQGDWPELNDGFAITAPVDTLLPNPFGLHHVHGNVMEWCRDAWDEFFYASSPFEDPVAPPGRGTTRWVMRGGSLAYLVDPTRSSARIQNTNTGDYDMGLRPARAVIRY